MIFSYFSINIMATFKNCDRFVKLQIRLFAVHYSSTQERQNLVKKLTTNFGVCHKAVN